MSDETAAVPPAMSAEEWHDEQHPDPNDHPDADEEWILDRRASRISYHADYKRFHACAALCLYGQPWGFTAEEAKLLRELGEVMGRGILDDYPAYQEQSMLRTLAAKVAALLPPTEGT